MNYNYLEIWKFIFITKFFINFSQLWFVCLTRYVKVFCHHYTTNFILNKLRYNNFFNFTQNFLSKVNVRMAGQVPILGQTVC